MAHQYGYASNSDQKRQGEANGQPLGSQEENLRQSDEDRDGCHHDCGDTRWHTLLGPEQETVVDQEDQQRE